MQMGYIVYLTRVLLLYSPLTVFIAGVQRCQSCTDPSKSFYTQFNQETLNQRAITYNTSLQQLSTGIWLPYMTLTSPCYIYSSPPKISKTMFGDKNILSFIINTNTETGAI